MNRKSKTCNGVTLLELLIAISLLTLIIFAGSGIYLSGMNISLDAQYSTQAHRNAQMVMMHIEKFVHNAASSFTINNNNNSGDKTLQFKSYNIDLANPDFSSPPSMLIQYSFDADLHQITFNSGNNSMVFNHINDCSFETSANDGVVLKVIVKAEDNKGENVYTLTEHIEAGLTASPSMYE